MLKGISYLAYTYSLMTTVIKTEMMDSQFQWYASLEKALKSKKKVFFHSPYRRDYGNRI